MGILENLIWSTVLYWSQNYLGPHSTGKKDQPVHALRLFITFVAQVAAVVIFIRLALDFLLAFTPAFLLPDPCMVSSCSNVPVALASDHAPFVVLAVVQAEALEFISGSVRFSYR